MTRLMLTLTRSLSSRTGAAFDAAGSAAVASTENQVRENLSGCSTWQSQLKLIYRGYVHRSASSEAQRNDGWLRRGQSRHESIRPRTGRLEDRPRKERDAAKQIGEGYEDDEDGD
jgi:hypothetical protein